MPWVTAPSRSWRAIRARAFKWSAPAPSGAKKQKHQVNRLIIESIEIDWFFQLREQSYQTVEPCQLAMWDRNAVTDTCRAQTFALKKRVEDFPFGKTGQFRRLTGEFLNCLFFAFGLEPGNYRVFTQKITKIH